MTKSGMISGDVLDVWTIEIESPMGAHTAELRFANADRSVGEMAGKSGDGPMEDLRIADGEISWFTRIEKPMPMKMKFSGTITGDEMDGKVKFGLFASGTFKGTRVT